MLISFGSYLKKGAALVSSVRYTKLTRSLNGEFNIGKYFQNSYRSEKTNKEKEDSRDEQNRKWGPFQGWRR